MRIPVAVAAAGLWLGPVLVAQNQSPLSGVSLIQSKGSNTLSAPMQVIVLLTFLTVLPAVIMSVTPFLRSVVVLHFLRQALGTQTTPSNQVLVGLALFVSLLVMQPVANDIYHKSWEPMESGKISASEAWDLATPPIKTFLLKFAREKDIRLFVELSHSPAPA